MNDVASTFDRSLPESGAAGWRGFRDQASGAAWAGAEDLTGLGTEHPTDAVTDYNRQTFDRMHGQAGGDSVTARIANAGDWAAHGATQALPIAAGGGAVNAARGLTPTVTQAARFVTPVATALGLNRQAVGNVGLFSAADAAKEQFDGTATLRSRALANSDAEHEMTMQTEQLRQHAIQRVQQQGQQPGSATPGVQTAAGPANPAGADGLRSVPPAAPPPARSVMDRGPGPANPDLDAIQQASAHPQAMADAAKQAPQAWAGIQGIGQQLESKAITPEQGAAQMTQHMDDFVASHAKATGMDPAQLKTQVAGMLQDGKFQPAEAQQLAQQLAPQAQAFGIQDIGKFINDSPMQAAAMAIGIPMAVLGIGQGLFGEGGFGSLLMTLLGVGGAAFGSGLTSGKGPLGGYAGQFRSLMGMDAPAAAPPPAAKPPAAGGAAPAATPMIPPAFATANEAGKADLLRRAWGDPDQRKQLQGGLEQYTQYQQRETPGTMPWMAQQAPWLARQFGVNDPETQFQNAAQQAHNSPEELRGFLDYARAHPELTPAR